MVSVIIKYDNLNIYITNIYSSQCYIQKYKNYTLRQKNETIQNNISISGVVSVSADSKADVLKVGGAQ